MHNFKQSMATKVIAWLITICLVVTLIPDIGYAAEDPAGEPTQNEAVTYDTAESETDPGTSEVPEEQASIADDPAMEGLTEDMVVDKTETTTTFDIGDGMEAVVFHGGAVRFENEEGELTDIDPTLVEIEDGEESSAGEELSGYSLRNSDGDKMQYFPEELSEGTPIRMEHDGYQILITPTDETVEMLGIESGKAATGENIVPDTYSGEGECLLVDAVYGNEDDPAIYQYTSGDAGIKETLILNERPENNVFTYNVDAGSLLIRENIEDEGLTFIDPETDEIVASIEAPWMNDATGEAYSEEIAYSIEEIAGKEGRYLIKMTADAGYLDDEKRVYPVTIDPTVTWKGDSELRDVYIIYGSGYANTNFYDSSIVRFPVGVNDTGKHRTLLGINNLKSTIEGKSVSSAKLTLYENGRGAAKQKIRANRITESWNATTLTWNNQPSFRTDVYIDQETTSGKQYEPVVFNLTGFAENTANGMANHGIILRNMTDDPSCASFYGSRNSSTAYRPKLVVTYYNKPTARDTANMRKKEASGFTTSSYFKLGEKVYTSWTGIKSPILSQVQYRITAYDSNTSSPTSIGTDKVDLTVYRNINKTATSASDVYVPYSRQLPAGKYKLMLRGKDSTGNTGPGMYKVFYVDGTEPSLTNVSVSPSTSASGYTTDKTPVVKWKATDDFFSKVIISLNGSNIKTVSSSGSGSYTIPAEKMNKSKKHVIKITAYDKAGNITSKTLNYYLDVHKPTGSIELKAQATGEPTEILKGTVSIAATVKDQGSGIDTSIRKIYRTVENEEGKLIKDESTEHVIDSDMKASRVAILDTVAHCSENGTYRLVLYIKDKVGHEKTVVKDVTVKNLLPKPKVTLDTIGTTTGQLNWTFPAGTSLSGLQYRFDAAEGWTNIAIEGEAVTGTAEIALPQEEGEHTIYVRGISSENVDGAVRSKKFKVDKTSPTVALTGYDKGYLTGTVTDINFVKWTLYVKEKDEVSFDDEPYKEGTMTAENGRICFVGFDDDVFESGKTYTFKISAEDIAGNTADAVMDIVAPEPGDIISEIPPELHIEREQQQERGERKFVVKELQGSLSLEENVTDADWYINNIKADNSFKKADGTLEYDEGVYHDVIAVRETANGQRQYSVPVISNVKESVDMTGGEIAGDSVTKELQFTDDVVSFVIDGKTPGVDYRIRTENGDFLQIQPDQEYHVSDLKEGIAYSDTFELEISVPDGVDPYAAECDFYYSYILNEEFMISSVENYAPEEFSAVDKINYKTYLSWDIPEDIPDNISFEVYRGEESGFEPGPDTLAASGLKEGYFAEINIQYSSDFYYRVCAVETDSSGKVVDRSSYSLEEGSSVVDEDEYAKYLGMKDYWEFTEFETANGNGYIEKSRGNFVYVQQDAEIPNEGLEVYLARTYNSQSSSQGAFGYGWSHDYDMELLNICEGDSLEFNNVVFKDGDGTIFYFSRNDESEEFKSSLGSYIELEAEKEDKTKSVKVSGDGSSEDIVINYRFIMATKDGMEYYFNSGGQLVYMEEANGNFLIFEHASTKGLLTRMLTNNNLDIEFIYQKENEGDPLLVKQIVMPDGSTVSYEYSRPVIGTQDLLTKVTAAAGDETIEYQYSYSGMILDSSEKNLTEIKDATGTRTYTLDYDNKDQVVEAKYPDNEKFIFEYSDDNTSTITKKYSDGEAVLGEKDYFENSTGRCLKSIRGVEDPAALDSSTPEQEADLYDVTEYNYTDGLLSSTVTTEEYNEFDENGYIVTLKKTETDTVEYEGDDPVKETESDGTETVYTYYPEDDNKGRAGLVKTVKETDPENNVVSDVHYDYDTNGNVTSEIDYAAGTYEKMSYKTDGPFKGELALEEEYLLPENSTDTTGKVLQSKTEYDYVYSIGSDGKTIKTETVVQTVPTKDGGNESVKVTTVYDQMGREISEEDSRGYVTSNAFDGFGRTISTDYRYSGVDSAKKTSNTTYDDNGLVTYEKLEDGIKKWYTYDNMQRVVAVKINKGNSDSTAQTVTTTYSYEDIEVFCGKGDETVTVKNAYKTESKCDGSIISATYEDNQGRIVRSYENGLYTDMTYNMQGDMITKWSMGKTISATEGLLEVYVYDKGGNLTHTITDPEYTAGSGFKIRESSEDEDGGSIVTESKYDDAGNVVTSIDPMGNQVDYSYDEAGNLTSATTPYRPLDAGNMDNEAGTEDSAVAVTESETAEGPVKATYEYQYDVAGDGNTTKDIVLEPHVDSSGNIVTAKSIVVKDSADRTVKVADLGLSDSDNTSIYTEYEYDIRDNLTKVKEKNGDYKKYIYDDRDRVTAIEYYEKSGDNAVRKLKTAFTYDDSDNMTSMSDYECNGDTESLYRYTAYGYDLFNRLETVAECDTDEIPSETEILSKQIKYHYDAKDNMTKIDYPDNSFGIESLEFEYNGDNWLIEVTANGNKKVREYEYDDFGKTSVITDYTDFLNDSSKWMKRTYSYDRFHRPVSIEYTDNMSGNETEIKEGHYYTYDSGSNITSETTVNMYGASNDAPYREVREYIYSDAGQLINTEVTCEDSEGTVTKQQTYSYEYDIIGNRTKESITTTESGNETSENTDFTYTEFNQLDTAVTKNKAGTVTADKEYTYDSNGNQTKETDSISSTEKTFSYDADNRLKTAEEKTGSTVEFKQTNKYNGFGQRVQKKEEISGSTDTVNYFYDGTSVLYTTDDTAMTALNLIGAEDNILATARPDGSSTDFYVYTKDLRESTINMVGSDGTAPVSYNYTDYGETTILGDEDFYNEVCYGAGIYDKTTGLYYLNARYYSPENGAFLTQDTYRGDRSRTATLNYYSYCAGNPISYTDPSGHAFWGIVGAALGAYDGYKYAKKKKLKGWKKAAAIVGGAALGAVNPFKVVKAAKKVYKAAKYTKKARSSYKKLKAIKKAAKKPKVTKVKTKKYKVKKSKPAKKKKYKKRKAKKLKKSKAKCFVAGTLISTEKGFTPIEQIKPGDYVWSENPETNEKALKKVNKIFVREKDSIIRLSINGEIIETTDEHPFYVEGKGFIGAGDLQTGDKVRLQSGQTASVDYAEEIQLKQPIKVYNFEVEDFHTYYVSEQKVLVHNTCAVKTKANSTSDGTSVLNPKDVRFSQSSVNGAAEIVNSMKKNGWKGDAIDVVAMPDGGLTSVDNTRLLAAKITGTDVKARVHSFDEPLQTKEMIERFTRGKDVPATWGDAVSIRIKHQNSGYRNTYPMGSNIIGWSGD